MEQFKKSFDQLILENLEDRGFGPFGYSLNGKTHPVYYSKEAFTAFIYEMGLCYPQHYCRYINGQGSELEETSAPPKMASVASSSRFAYLALRHGAQAIGGTEQVEFEHECRITGIRGTAPQLDAYTTDAKGNPIYIEVKCHEIFDPHKVKLRAAYWQKIYGNQNDFGFPEQDALFSENFTIPLSEFGIDRDHSMVDIKQLLCHLMGIASQKEANRTATLVYLFFRPTVPGRSGDSISHYFCRLIDEMDRVFISTPIRNFCTAHKIDLKVVVEETAVMEKLTDKNIGYLRDYPHK